MSATVHGWGPQLAGHPPQLGLVRGAGSVSPHWSREQPRVHARTTRSELDTQHAARPASVIRFGR